jgi:CRP/FNR family transcriptional regulator, cyclic AMP receptor protein
MAAVVGNGGAGRGCAWSRMLPCRTAVVNGHGRSCAAGPFSRAPGRCDGCDRCIIVRERCRSNDAGGDAMWSFAIEVLGYVASAFVVATYFVRTMMPLRYFAICANVLFICYGLLAGIYQVFFLHLILFPINTVRLIQIRQLVAQVREANKGEIPISSLLPFMQQRSFKAGEVLVRKGDIAESFFYIAQGKLKLEETGRILDAGAIAGAIGIFAPDHKRTLTITAESDAVVYEMSGAKAMEMYFQDPKFGFAVLQLIITRLLDQIARSQARVASDAPKAAA